MQYQSIIKQKLFVRLFFGLALSFGIIFQSAGAYAEQAQHAIVTAVSGDGMKASYSWIQERKSGGSRLSEHNMMPTVGDIRAATHGQYYFIMEGGGLNRITCFDITNLDAPVWQYDAQAAEETGDARPWALLSINDHKAYLLRYGSSTAWIVDPLAPDEKDFKTGEIDLSAYDDGDGSPEMCCGAVANGKAFIALKRLDADGMPQTAYLAVIDTATNASVNTGKGEDGLPGIALSTKNPVSMQYLEKNDTIYVQGVGALAPQPDYTGGIERIDPNTYKTQMILDDGDANAHPYGYITGMAVISSTDGFFIGAQTESDNTLYHFNPETGDAEAVELNASDPEYLQNKQFAGLNGGIGQDKHKRLWLSNISNRAVEILITAPNQGLYSGDGRVQIPDDNAGRTMQPSQIVFCQEPEITEEDEAAKPSSSGDSGNFCFINTLLMF